MTRRGISRDHPRIRGEHVRVPTVRAAHVGSSPHTRGALGAAFEQRVIERIIPAYAGSTGTNRAGSSTSWDHPRIRGEHLPRVSQSPTLRGSSPHTRGAQREVSPGPVPFGIIPAYAGSTFRRSWPTSPSADHPRIRGEHETPRSKFPGGFGSSPHTRGAPIK